MKKENLEKALNKLISNGCRLGRNEYIRSDYCCSAKEENECIKEDDEMEKENLNIIQAILSEYGE